MEHLKLSDMQFIDLGLPSGKLWADQNEVGYFNFEQAVEKFGDSMLTADDFQEIHDHCRWNWDNERLGYTVTGKNGNSIFLPASGCRYGSGLSRVGRFGYYWSRTAYGTQFARSLEFWSGSVLPQGSYYRYFGFAVRLVKSPDDAKKNTEEEQPKLTVIPEEKLKHYLRAMKEKPTTSKVFCDCGKLVDITPIPYAYDDKNNDVWYAALCPHCGELILTKE